MSLVCHCSGFSLDGGLTKKLLLILVPLVCDCWALIQDSEEFVWDIHGDTTLTGNALDLSFSSRCICIELLEVV